MRAMFLFYQIVPFHNYESNIRLISIAPNIVITLPTFKLYCFIFCAGSLLNYYIALISFLFWIVLFVAIAFKDNIDKLRKSYLRKLYHEKSKFNHDLINYVYSQWLFCSKMVSNVGIKYKISYAF